MRRSTRIRSAPSATAAVDVTVAVVTRKVRGPREVRTTSTVSKRPLSSQAAGVEVVKKIKVESVESAVPNAQQTDTKSVVSSIKSEANTNTIWHDLCAVQELSCVVTLTSGQVFTWKKYTPESDVWIGVVGQHVYKLREHERRVHYQIVHPPYLSNTEAFATLHDYFRLEVEAAPLYAKWSEKDDDMSKIIKSLPGLRIIRQDPVECLFAFICSSNNNIQRITQMITKLKSTYGELLFHDPATDEKFFSFPAVETLATRAEEQILRDLGFGYRAPFIIKSSELLRERGGREFLMSLREPSTSGDEDEYAGKLMEFSGVGRKVADCIGLFSLNKLHAIPVDTHVWQIACREFDPSLKSKKSITPTVYQAVGDHFRARFSPLAGWAHSVLFTGDLSSFKDHLPEDMQSQRKKKKPATAKSSTTSKPKEDTKRSTDMEKRSTKSTVGGRNHKPKE